MLKDMQQVSSWYVLHKDFKVYECCTKCSSKKISYYKVKTQTHSGFAPECADCGKIFPVRMKLTLNNKAPLERNFAIDDETFGRIWEWASFVK